MSERDPIQVSEDELRAMTRDLDEMHNETFPKLREQLGDLASSLRRNGGNVLHSSATRRGFLFGSALTVGGVALAACGSSNPSSTGAGAPSTGSTGSASPSASSSASADVAGLKTNASLENLAVFAYGAALSDAPKGKFGTVPPAIAEFATYAMKQHSDHATAFNAALKNAGQPAYTDPDPALKQMVLDAYGKVNDLPGLAKLALLLENTAAATYTKQMGEFTSSDALGAVATIAPVERQHASILYFVLGEYPVPDTFVPLDLARPSSDVA